LALLRASNLFVARIVANSQAVKESVHRREGYPLDRIEVFFNGHAPGRFEVAPLQGFRAQLGIGESDPIVGMVANFHAWKRHADLLHAFALVSRKHPRAHLVLVGEGVLEPALKTTTRSLGLDRLVHFVGATRDVIPIVRHFSVGVLCSETEGLSNAVFEYMGSGKPTVCTDVGGNRELIVEGETGFFVHPRDIGGLAGRIMRLLARPDLRREMGERARCTAGLFTADRMAESYMQLYDDLTRTKVATRSGRSTRVQLAVTPRHLASMGARQPHKSPSSPS
jgi:glycosyltransferase involved in cell wall biosynthesis